MVAVVSGAVLPVIRRYIFSIRLTLAVVSAAAIGVFAQTAVPQPPSSRVFEPEPGQALQGLRISEIFFDPPVQPVSREQLGISLRLRPGDRYDAQELSRAIQRLYATGRFQEIEVEATETGRAVQLLFRTSPKLFVGAVNVIGVPEPPNESQLLSAAGLDLGTEYVESAVPDAIDRLKTSLANSGYFQASVGHEVERKNIANQVYITFVVTPGPRYQFERPVFTGELQAKPYTLIRKSDWQQWWGLRGWKKFSQPTLQNGLANMRLFYQEKDHLRARVAATDLKSDPVRFKITPQVEVDPGPKIRLLTTGAKVSKGTLRTLVPIYQEQAVDRELLIEGQRNLRNYFQGQGYFSVDVDYNVGQTDEKGAQTITYEIERRDRYRLVNVTFRGNDYFSDEILKERLSIQPGGTLRYRRGRFSRALLDQDLQGIADVYRANGFRDVDVTSEQINSFEGKENDIGIMIRIREGQQWLVDGVELTGVDLRLLPEIQPLITAGEGQPFSLAGVSSDRDSILNYYFNAGYPEATLDYTITPDDQAKRVSIVYNITEGRRNYIRDVIVSGLETTRPNIVDRRITLEPGEPLSQAALVETQRRLYDLGIFARVDVAIQNQEGLERNKYVLIQAEEAKRYSVTFGLGAELGRIGGDPNNLSSPAGAAGFSPRIVVGVTRLNVFGTGHTAGLTGRASNYQRRALLTYTAPQFQGNSRFSLAFNGLYDYARDIRTYTSIRYEVGMQLTQLLNRADSLQYRIAWRRVQTENLAIDPDLVPVFSQPVRVGLTSISYIRDRRDDPLDSTRGSFNTADFGVATKYLGSQTEYTRVVLRNTTYTRIGRDLIFARSTSFGWLHNMKEEPVPLPELFYAGGSSTHRGFPDNQAGPRDLTTGFPVGGAAFLLFGQEIRFPLLGRAIGGVLFYDFGNVYTDLSTLSFRTKQKNVQDFDYAVHAPGFGVRLRTPIGPVRVDFGYSMNSPRFFGCEGDRTEVIESGCESRPLQRVNKFQFHFSLGQTF